MLFHQGFADGVFEVVDHGIAEALPDESVPIAPSDPSTPAAGATAQVVRILEDDLNHARIEAAQAVVTVKPAGWILLSDVAEVRAGNAVGECVIDFQAMRTVSGVAYNDPSGEAVPPTIKSLRAWTGTEFGDAIDNDASSNQHQMRMSERLTERLSVVFENATALTADLLRAHGTVNLPSPPGEV